MPFFRSGGSEIKSSIPVKNDSVSTLGAPAASRDDEGAHSTLQSSPPPPPPSWSSSSPDPPPREGSSSARVTRGGGTKGEDNAIVSEPWTRIFPEAFGIRRTIEDSPFRWCVRESFLWGVATGTMMGM